MMRLLVDFEANLNGRVIKFNGEPNVTLLLRGMWRWFCSWISTLMVNAHLFNMQACLSTAHCSHHPTTQKPKSLLNHRGFTMQATLVMPIWCGTCCSRRATLTLPSNFRILGLGFRKGLGKEEPERVEH